MHSVFEIENLRHVIIMSKWLINPIHTNSKRIHLWFTNGTVCITGSINSGNLFPLLWFTRLKPYLLCNIYLYTCICLTCLHPSLRPHSFSFMCFISFFWNNFWTQNLVLGKRTNVGVVCICCAKIINCIKKQMIAYPHTQ